MIEKDQNAVAARELRGRGVPEKRIAKLEAGWREHARNHGTAPEESEITLGDYRDVAADQYADEESNYPVVIARNARVDLLDPDGAWVDAQVWVPRSEVISFIRLRKRIIKSWA